MISQTVITPVVKTPIEPKAIKSYIYLPPKIESLPPPVMTTEEEEKISSTVIEEKIATKEKPEEKKVTKEVNKTEEPIVPAESIEPIINKDVQIKPQAAKKISRSFSAYGQLKNLQKNLDEQMFEQESVDFGKSNTGSIMHGKPSLVPHSEIQISEEEKTKRASKQISSDLTFTKGDDGSCTVKRDLSVVGMEGLTSVESFACGKSKFDKSFQDHMKKVREKLGKK